MAEVSGVSNGNGTYGSHQSYGTGEQQNSYGYADPVSSQPMPLSSSAPSNANNSNADISKDEVGWYFVEQYYTTLSRSPEKLFLFYNKRSQFVSGRETDKVPVCIGQRAINDKIRQLDFQDCKVRVTNVDSQASDSNIVIQVIGEISNKSQPHKKFTQTFVLATQTNGYFVLNDIFRYLIEEEDESEAETPAAAAAPAASTVAPESAESKQQESAPVDDVKPQTLTNSADPAAVESDAQKLDRELEKESQATPTPASTANGSATKASAETSSVPAAAETSKPAELETEVPKDPEPTRVATPQAAQQQQQAHPPKPAVPAGPKSWASLAASANKTGSANKVATPIIPAASSTASRAAPAGAKGAAASSATSTAPAPSASPAPTAPAAAAAAAAGSETGPAAAPVPNGPAAQQTVSQNGPSTEGQDEWVSVGNTHNRQQSRQVNAPTADVPQFRGYIKNVSDNVDANALKAALDKFGKVTHFDVVRFKNCAFVDYETAEGYSKALGTPLELGDGGEKLYVEERRPNKAHFVPRGGYQGNRGSRGGYQGPPRGGYQNHRGNSAPRGRGGPLGARGGRGGAPAAA